MKGEKSSELSDEAQDGTKEVKGEKLSELSDEEDKTGEKESGKNCPNFHMGNLYFL